VMNVPRYRHFRHARVSRPPNQRLIRQDGKQSSARALKQQLAPGDNRP
jgi:hypothetical protein